MAAGNGGSWLDTTLPEAVQNMPVHYRQHCLDVKVMRKCIARFLEPREGGARHIAATSSLNVQGRDDIPAADSPLHSEIPASGPPVHSVQPERTPKELALQMNQFAKVLLGEVDKMNKFLVSTHRSQARTANRYMLMRQDAERRQKLIEPPIFPYGRVHSKELEEIRLATFRHYSDMYELLVFSKINCEAIQKILEEHDLRTGSEMTSTFMELVKTQDIIAYRESMITEAELCRILVL